MIPVRSPTSHDNKFLKFGLALAPDSTLSRSLSMSAGVAGLITTPGASLI